MKKSAVLFIALCLSVVFVCPDAFAISNVVTDKWIFTFSQNPTRLECINFVVLSSTIDYSKADEPVSAKDFLNLIYRTQFILHHTGGFGRAELVRDIDYLKKSQDVNEGK